MAKAKATAVTVETIVPVKEQKAFLFEYKGHQVNTPANYTITREQFNKMFTGRISIDLNEFWKAYQTELKKQK